MDAFQRKFLARRFKELYVPGWRELRRKLLLHGGLAMVPMPEPPEDVQRLLQTGRLFQPKKVRLQPGRRKPEMTEFFRPNGCHGNCARYWASFEGFQLVTGYALSDDGLWRQHSWLWEPGKQHILETTVPFDSYFGAPLAGIEALHFTFRNSGYSEKEIPPVLLRRILEFQRENPDVFLSPAR